MGKAKDYSSYLLQSVFSLGCCNFLTGLWNYKKGILAQISVSCVFMRTDNGWDFLFYHNIEVTF